MKYGQAISSAFSTLKSGALWGFAASIYGSMVLLYLVLAGGAAAIVGPQNLVNLIEDPTSNPSAWIAPIAALVGALFLAFVLMLPLTLIMHGGLIHLSDELLAKRPVTTGQAWAFGASRMGRTFAIEFLVGLIAFGAFLVAAIPFGLGIAALAVGSDPGTSGGAFVGACCGYLIFLLFVVGLSLLISGYEAIAIRYGLVGTRSAGESLSAGWQAFRARWKNVIVFSLIVLGLGYAFSIATSMITTPLQFLLVPGSFMFGSEVPSADQIPRLISAYAVIMLVSVVLAVPWAIFRYSLWGAFFRQITGLDVVAAPPAAPESLVTPAPPAPPESQEPPVTAELPAPPAPPVAPESQAPTEPAEPAEPADALPGTDG